MRRRVVNRVQVEEWIVTDDAEESLDDQEIISQVLNQNDKDSLSKEDGCKEKDNEQLVSQKEGVTALETALRYVEQQEEVGEILWQEKHITGSNNVK